MITICDSADLFAFTKFIKDHFDIKHSRAQQITASVFCTLNYNHAVSVLKETPSINIANETIIHRLREISRFENIEFNNADFISNLTEFRKKPDSRNVVQPKLDDLIEPFDYDNNEADEDLHLERYIKAHKEFSESRNGTYIGQIDRTGIMVKADQALRLIGFDFYKESERTGYEDSEFYADTIEHDGKTYGLEVVCMNTWDDEFLYNVYSNNEFSFQVCLEDDGILEEICTSPCARLIPNACNNHNIPQDVIDWAEKRAKQATKVIAPLNGKMLYI